MKHEKEMQSCMAAKMHEIKTKGIRGKKVSRDQMVAVALSHCRKTK